MRAIAAACLFLTGAGILACKKPPPVEVAPVDAASGVASAPDARGPCHANADCPADDACVFTPGLCGKGKRSGACLPRPAVCTEMYEPVCGCDGKVYESACAARIAGVDVSVTGGCKEKIAGWAACGGHYCDVRTSYCEIFLSDVPEPPTDSFCRALPPSCLPGDGAARGCDCFPRGTRCAEFCGPLPTAPGAMSGFHLTCQGRRAPAD
jgi:hypothetical protein